VVERAIAAALDAASHGIRYWQVDPTLRNLAVRAEPAALEAALAALLRRAALHTRDGDIISLRCAKGSDWVAFVVEDEGDGLLPPDDETDPAGILPGGDLGLAQARRLATSQGGDVQIEATPGVGARAWLTLPRGQVLEPN
jgi:signal transduction histidine kinase